MKKEWRRSGERKASHLNACDCQSEDIKVPHVTHRGDSSVLVKMSSGTTWHLGLYCQNALCVCVCVLENVKREREPTSPLLWFGHCVIIHWFTAISYPNNQKSTYTHNFVLLSFPYHTSIYTLEKNLISIFWHSLFYMTWWRQLYRCNYNWCWCCFFSVFLSFFSSFPIFYYHYHLYYYSNLHKTKKYLFLFYFLKKSQRRKSLHITTCF